MIIARTAVLAALLAGGPCIAMAAPLEVAPAVFAAAPLRPTPVVYGYGPHRYGLYGHRRHHSRRSYGTGYHGRGTRTGGPAGGLPSRN